MLIYSYIILIHNIMILWINNFYKWICETGYYKCKTGCIGLKETLESISVILFNKTYDNIILNKYYVLVREG